MTCTVSRDDGWCVMREEWVTDTGDHLAATRYKYAYKLD